MVAERAWSTPTRISPWVELVKLVASGTMGEVWRGFHRGLDLPVAVKLLAQHFASEPEVRERFAQEARAAAKIDSDYVVRYYDYGETEEGRPFIVMEWLTGVTLQQMLDEQGPLPPRSVVYIVDQLARALRAVHAAGVVHRDVKPDNAVLVPQGERLIVKLVDFSVSSYVGGKPGKLTRPGTLVGTPSYMSREQVLYGRADWRTDVWSLGVLAYELLTGQLPFQGETVGGVCAAIVEGDYLAPSARLRELGTPVDAWFARAVAAQPGDRFSSPSELAQALSLAIRESFGRDAEGSRDEEPSIELDGELEDDSISLVPVTQESTPGRRGSWRWLLFATLLLCGSVVAAWQVVGTAPLNDVLPDLLPRHAVAQLVPGANAQLAEHAGAAWVQAQQWREDALRYETAMLDCLAIPREVAQPSEPPKPAPVRAPRRKPAEPPKVEHETAKSEAEPSLEAP